MVFISGVQILGLHYETKPHLLVQCSVRIQIPTTMMMFDYNVHFAS
jgi:hypothetical protein